MKMKRAMSKSFLTWKIPSTRDWEFHVAIKKQTINTSLVCVVFKNT
jgi:hypothetical protein